jgi:hypothetical protein
MQRVLHRLFRRAQKPSSHRVATIDTRWPRESLIEAVAPKAMFARSAAHCVLSAGVRNGRRHGLREAGAAFERRHDRQFEHVGVAGVLSDGLS